MLVLLSSIFVLAGDDPIALEHVSPTANRSAEIGSAVPGHDESEASAQESQTSPAGQTPEEAEESEGKQSLRKGNSFFELHPITWMTDAVDVMLGPLQEANLLLPEGFDPFVEQVSFSSLAPEETAVISEALFEPSEQCRLLGSKLAFRIDTPEQEAVWHWQAQAGGSFRQGNTSNTNLRSVLEIDRESRFSVMRGNLGLVFNRNGKDDPNFRAFGEFVVDSNLRGSWILYVRQDLEYDEVKLIDLRSVTSSGLGFKFIDQLTKRLVVRTGPTFVYINFDSDARAANEVFEGWLGEAEYRRLLGESTRLEFTSTVLPDFEAGDRIRFLNNAALLFPIGGNGSPWHWKVGVRHQLERNAARNTRRSDTEGFFSITYSK